MDLNWRWTLVSIALFSMAVGPLMGTAPGAIPSSGKEFAESPEWFRRCPALYIPTPTSAGAVMLSFTGSRAPVLTDLIDSFRDMPALLEEARSLGTNCVYLVDYYQGWQGEPAEGTWWSGRDSLPSYMRSDEQWWFRNAWWNKGDYVPRLDLGGAEALKAGIAAVHRAGGRVIVYVEGFIVAEQSRVGQEHGAEWAIQTEEELLGPTAEPYHGNWKMCPACPGWVDHVVDVCRRLVSEYDIDGVHIDSFGAQRRGYRCVNKAHGHPIDGAQVFHDGRTALAKEVRAAIQAKNPEAVVMIELPDMMALFEFVDGSQDWGFGALRRRPLWDKAGLTDVFTAGWSLDHIHQVLAAGHKLSLGRFWIEAPEGLACTEAVKSRILDYRNEKPASNNRKLAYLKDAAHALFKWHNAGLLQNLSMPDLGDLNSSIHSWLPNRFQSEEKLEGLLVEIEKYAKDVDAAFVNRSKVSLSSGASHLRELLGTRSELSHIIDDGAIVQALESGQREAFTYLFDSQLGSVLTIVNVGNELLELTINLSEREGSGYVIDEQSGVKIEIQEGALAVPVPAHSIRMLRVN